MAPQPLPRRSRGPASTSQWLIVVLLSVIATCLLIEATASPGHADGVSSASAGSGVVVVAGQLTGDSYGMYLVDVDKGTMAMYQYVPNVRKLRLMAARNYTFDLQLENYNTELPPGDVKDLVEQQKRLEPATRPY